ncbi:dnaJ homolog subfamily C member 24-like [Acanthaster planci]|uniref:DnaJ homolog subfamily C member 24-like n=1 Tax=Acanthaster planci TaxID=133434 RepID=A0A8B7XSL0_ACAPL|nr:dnaJ homolog subfamily C member 24-like [Acanthaster planci]
MSCHPDKLPPTCSEAERAAALQRFHLVDTAWRTLGDEASRKEYDARQTEKEMRKPWPLNEKVHVDEMDWQEDEEVYSYSCRCGGEYVVTVKDIDQNVSIVGCNTCTLSIELVQGGSSEVQIGNSVQPT